MNTFAQASPNRQCHICKNTVGKRKSCPTCTEWVKTLPHPDSMTGRERVDELKLWRGALEIEFGLMHERLEALVGRPVWITEFGLNYDGLIEEARNMSIDEPVSYEEAVERGIACLPDDVQVIKVRGEDYS